MTGSIPGVEPGTFLGGYRIEALIGRGGMGLVYLAEQVALGRRVALKLVAPELAGSPEFQARFDRESRMAAAIDHPNVVPLFEAGRIGEIAYLAMRYIDGIDLRSLIAARGRLTPGTAAHVVAQIGGALDAAHARGLVHRDVKPANVLVADPGGAMHCYLTDFGLTKQMASHGGLTATGHWVGTLDYVAPEQVAGAAVDARTDVYALGCVLFQMLTGHVPFPRDSDVAKLYAHAHEPPPAPSAAAPDLPPTLDEAVRRALAKAPDERYPSAGDLARATQAAVAGGEVSDPERSVAAGPAAPSRGRGSSPAAVGAGTRLDSSPPEGWVPAPTGSTPPTQAIPGRRGGAGVAAAIIVAALLLAGGGVAVALVLTGKDDSPAPSAQTTDIRTDTATDTSARAGPAPTVRNDLEPFSAATFTAQAPADWTLEQDDEAQPDGRRVSKWRGPDGSTLLIDTTPGFNGGVMESAVKLEEDQAGRGGYKRLLFEPFTSAGDDAFEWDFRDGQTGTYKADLFVTRAGDGFAVLGETSTRKRLKQVRSLARAMIDSIEPD